MAEIEHFCDPRDKSHPKFEEVAAVEAALYSACDQMDGKPAKKVKIGQAVKEVSESSIIHLNMSKAVSRLGRQSKRSMFC